MNVEIPFFNLPTWEIRKIAVFETPCVKMQGCMKNARGVQN